MIVALIVIGEGGKVLRSSCENIGPQWKATIALKIK